MLSPSMITKSKGKPLVTSAMRSATSYCGGCRCRYRRSPRSGSRLAGAGARSTWRSSSGGRISAVLATGEREGEGRRQRGEPRSARADAERRLLAEARARGAADARIRQHVGQHVHDEVGFDVAQDQVRTGEAILERLRQLGQPASAARAGRSPSAARAGTARSPRVRRSAGISAQIAARSPRGRRFQSSRTSAWIGAPALPKTSPRFALARSARIAAAIDFHARRSRSATTSRPTRERVRERRRGGSSTSVYVEQIARPQGLREADASLRHRARSTRAATRTVPARGR